MKKALKRLEEEVAKSGILTEFQKQALEKARTYPWTAFSHKPRLIFLIEVALLF